MDNAPFISLIKTYSVKAEEYLRDYFEAPEEEQSEENLRQQLLGYVKRKYMLDDDDCSSRDFSELGTASIAKTAKIPKDGVSEQDLSMNCAGISSVTTKKILLIISLQKRLNIRIDPNLTPQLKTVDDLAAVIYQALEDYR